MSRWWCLGAVLAGLAIAVVASAGDTDSVTVPGGPFWMGCNPEVDDQCADNEKPGREVDVAAFAIDRREVSAARYGECVAGGACRDAPAAPECTASDPARADHPVNCLIWEEAAAFCAWAGGRLPTEAEWEKAARGSDRRKYPWGNQGMPAAGRVANICDVACTLAWRLAEYDDGFAATAPTGSFPAGASPYGVLNMGGNVWEWTADAWGAGPERVIRGGSWNNQARNTRVSMRSGLRPEARAPTVGLRCAYAASGSKTSRNANR
jgi:formylglycine-generating enzyme required for sulfatase activity